MGDTRYGSWLRHYATSRKVAVSIASEVTMHYGPGVDSASNRNEYHESSSGYRAVSAQG
jgi:hypothetical protein